MAELVPLPLPLLLRRAFHEYRNERKIFDLPENKFFRGFPGLDLSVDFHGHRASTPLGPAAGPHGQLAQNIALSWLGGARIIELKTVQILDELKIPRPCIDVANIGFNVEWSQELKLEQSLREYVGAAMFLEIVKASGLLRDGIPADTVFDMSVGYNLEGIQSPRVRSWIASMMDATAVIDELRTGLRGEWPGYCDLPFPTCISDTISLSTFHGCPAGEIEGIVTFLLAEMGCHVCIKLNPTLLGPEQVAHLLHDVLGYQELQLHPPAFENDLRFDEARDLIPLLQSVARKHRRSLSVKFTNTLVVKNHKRLFSDEVMYLSGAPLHLIAMTLVEKFRERQREPIAVSFSGGLDAKNMASAVAMNFVPVTTCTDLLRPGGYGRLIRYLENLAAVMRQRGATTVADFVLNYRGQAVKAAGDVNAAGLLNTPILVAEAAADPRYRWENNRGVPRKIGSNLWLYDCIACDKCIPVCPNDANFVYETGVTEIAYQTYEIAGSEARPVPGGTLRIAKARQFANYADACNECGNCNIFCPEDGGPFVEKPRFFGSFETFSRDAGQNGFFIDFAHRTIHGVISGKHYALAMDEAANRACFEQQDLAAEIQLSENRLLNLRPSGSRESLPGILDLLPYLKLKVLYQSVGDPRRAHFVNAGALPAISHGSIHD